MADEARHSAKDRASTPTALLPPLHRRRAASRRVILHAPRACDSSFVEVRRR
jgi:hypothetical protein